MVKSIKCFANLNPRHKEVADLLVTPSSSADVLEESDIFEGMSQSRLQGWGCAQVSGLILGSLLLPGCFSQWVQPCAYRAPNECSVIRGSTTWFRTEV